MIDIKELRVGDVLLNTEEDARCSVHSIDRTMGVDSIHTINDECIYNYPKDYYEPIIITEDLLLKLGFHIENDNVNQIKYYMLRLNGYRIDINKCSNTLGKDYGIHIDNLSCYSVLSGDIQYLHQLQNAIFDATGEELNVNELFK